jgi:hypothetical protein
MKLAWIGGYPKLSSYQCINCKEVMTIEDGAGIGSYFDWLMSRPRSKRAHARQPRVNASALLSRHYERRIAISRFASIPNSFTAVPIAALASSASTMPIHFAGVDRA